MKKILTVLMMLLVLLVINVGCGSSSGVVEMTTKMDTH